MSLTPAVILGSGTGGLSFARSLGRRGVPLWMLSASRFVGEWSRYARVIRLPISRHEPNRWLDTLEQLADQGARVLFPMHDEYVQLLARHYERIAARYKILMPAPKTVHQIMDKQSQYAIVQAAGVNVPRAFYPKAHADITNIAARISFPCIVKPRVSHVWHSTLQVKARVAHTPQALERALRDIPLREFLVQEIVPGGDEQIFVYLGYWDALRGEVAHVVLNKLRQYPPVFGDGALFETVNVSQVLQLSRTVLRAFDYAGIADVEFKFDARTDTWSFIEINPRAAGMTEIAPRTGVDYAWLAYCDLLEQPVARVNTYQLGVRMMNEEIDLLAFWELRRRRELKTMAWLKSLRGAQPMIFAWDDPLPFLHGGGRIVKRLFGNSRPL